MKNSKKMKRLGVGIVSMLLLTANVQQTMAQKLCPCELDTETKKALERVVLLGDSTSKGDSLWLKYKIINDPYIWLLTKKTQKDSCFSNSVWQYTRYAKKVIFSGDVCMDELKRKTVIMQSGGNVFEEENIIPLTEKNYQKMLQVSEEYFLADEGKKMIKNVLKAKEKALKEQKKKEKKEKKTQK